MGGVGGVVVQSHFIVKPNLLLRLGWGFDNKTLITPLKHFIKQAELGKAQQKLE